MKFRKIKKNKILIPDNDLNGVSDSVTISSDHKVTHLNLMVELEHSHPGDLSIEIIAPSGNKEVLLSPGNNNQKTECFYLPVKDAANLASSGTQGEWTVNLIDTGMSDQGYLLSWELDFDVESREENILIEDQSVMELMHMCDEGGELESLDLEMEIEHAHLGDLRISLMGPDGHEEIIHDREGKDGNYLMIKKNSFQLQSFKNKQVKGLWRVIVEDALKGDSGIIKNWSIQISTRD